MASGFPAILIPSKGNYSRARPDGKPL